jgi:hypothetical protein
MVEIEVQLAKAFGWSLGSIDETDASHLLEFINHLTGGQAPQRVYADQVSWL